MQAAETLNAIRGELSKVIVGQHELVDAMLVGLLTGGHVLLEGVPGLAKTLAVKSLAKTIGARFARIQFTPDLLPSDIVGTTVFLPEQQRFERRIGPIAANIVLVDEINRAPAKVQSALLEAMQEGQVTLDGVSLPLPSPFLVIATQNPLEQAGTYPLPEAQKDRFALQCTVQYPARAEEMLVVERYSAALKPMPELQPVATLQEIADARAQVDQVHLETELRDYALDIVVATRPGQAEQLSSRQRQARLSTEKLIETGASPRAGIAIVLTARALALMDGRTFALPDDIQRAAVLTLPHRIRPSFEADVQKISPIKITQTILEELAAP